MNFCLISKQQARKYTKTCLKVILGDMYISYSAALEMCGLETLYDRRQKRCLEFALKNVKHNRNKKMFPLNLTMDTRKENMKDIK